MDTQGESDGSRRRSPLVRKLEQLQPTKMYSRRHKRMKAVIEEKDDSSSSKVMDTQFESLYKRRKSLPNVLDYSDPFTIPNLMEEQDHGVYGSATKDIEDLLEWTMHILTPVFLKYPALSNFRVGCHSDADQLNGQCMEILQMANKESSHLASHDIVDLDNDCLLIDPPTVNNSKSDFVLSLEKTQESGGRISQHATGNCDTLGQLKISHIQNDIKNNSNKDVVIIDSDEEYGTEKTESRHSATSNLGASNFKSQQGQMRNPCNLDLEKSLINHTSTFSHDAHYNQHSEENQKACYQYQEVVLKKPIDEHPITVFADKNGKESKVGQGNKRKLIAETEKREEGLYVYVQEDLVSAVEITYVLALEAPKSLLPRIGTLYNEAQYNQQGRKNQETGKAFLGSDQHASSKYQEVVFNNTISENHKEFSEKDVGESKVVEEGERSLNAETETRKEKGLYVGVREDSNVQSDPKDGLGDMWREMMLALEFSKDAAGEISTVDCSGGEEDEECDHSFVLKDDIGYVCRVCGIIKKSIETIFDFQWGKGSKTTRTYMAESRIAKDKQQKNATTFSERGMSEQDVSVAEVSLHPRHMKQMKPHQLEGFNFLVRNLLADDPGGCILAHAPGSGKTFIIVSFIQSFLAKYPKARALVILPKGILATSKREFQRWLVEDIPLYDLYTTKAEKRSEQLEILKQWMEHKSVLFLGYKQFSNIVCSSTVSKTAADCHDLLLQVPSILMLDEGHTPRNEDTDVLSSLAKVQTPRKVVMSGTLFQNHVKEVFNILNLVRPKFLKLDGSKAIKRRIMSRVHISNGRRQLKANGGDATFYELVEETLKCDEDFKRKVTIIQDLREMTRDVLHYYKGDFLDELPGLVDFTVLLNLSPKQKHAVEQLKSLEKFRRSSIGTAVYLHPHLKEFSETALLGDRGCNFNEDKMVDLLNKIDIRDGVKAKFFLNMLGLCESSGEKLLVFSQYLLPLKFLEKLVVKTKGWRLGKEFFMISGDSNPEQRECSMESFNSSPDAKLFFGSIKACGEGISLVGASRVMILDVHLNPSVTRQAIGRAFRPGQLRKVYIYRLVAAESPEEESHQTCFRKELISKMWFEWNEYCNHKDFELETVDVKDTDDMFWDSPALREDVKLLYKR